MFNTNKSPLERGEWGAVLKGRDNMIVLKQQFYVLIGYPNFLRNLRQDLRIGKENEMYFSHITNLVKMFNSSKDKGSKNTILSSLQYYLENAYVDPTGLLIINDLLDCIYTSKEITFDKYRYTVKTALELFEEVSQMETAEKYYIHKPTLNNRQNSTILSLEDELNVLFKKLGLKGMVTLAEVLTSLVYIKD